MSYITHLYRYPFKGLTPEVLQRVTLQVGKTIALDRRFALAHGTTEFNADAPVHLSKTKFLMLMKNERLAALQTAYNDNTGLFQIRHHQTVLASGDLQTSEGREHIENCFATYLGDEIRGKPKIVEASGHSFSDVNAKVLSCINLATVRDLEKVLQTRIDPLRFRANVYFEGVPPWAELDWIGKTLRLGGATVKMLKPIERCAATNVNPETAARDLHIPNTLLKNYGHRHLGIYVHVIEKGEVTINDDFSIVKE